MQIAFKDFNEDKQIINEYIHFWFRENYIEKWLILFYTKSTISFIY